MDDLVHAILTNPGQLTVAALAGNAAAGGLMLAAAADQVWCREGAVLNPHYRLMGLHGSEYWTYTLPRRVGASQAARLTRACLPVTPSSALRSGLVDRVIAGDAAAFRAELAVMSRNFSDPREPYARLRRAFVYKEKPTHTPPHLARHRTHPQRPQGTSAPAPVLAAAS